jgi:hypothetical protein
MNASVHVDEVKDRLAKRYGSVTAHGRGQVFTFGTGITCSINYSKLLGGHKFFYAVPGAMLKSDAGFPQTSHGEFVLLICGSPDRILVLPRSLVAEMLCDVPSRRVDVFIEQDAYILQTTKHPKLDVTEYLNAFPKPDKPADDGASEAPAKDRIHVKVQWQLAKLGLAEGCSIWVPTNDRNFSFKGDALSVLTLPRLPHLGLDPNSRRIVENIDVLWLSQNAILKAFEIESTTSIYSGLLRLSDLIVSQPNIQIDLFITSALTRRAKVQEQMYRPTLRSLLPKCAYLSFEDIDRAFSLVNAIAGNPKARVAGILQGEHFTLPSHYVYPTQL